MFNRYFGVKIWIRKIGIIACIIVILAIVGVAAYSGVFDGEK